MAEDVESEDFTSAMTEDLDYEEFVSRIMGIEEFVYDKLPDSTGHKAASHAIRLLKISDVRLPFIRCTLRTYNYECCPDYLALSYTWGPVAPLWSILVDGRRFLIRDNLLKFITLPLGISDYL